MRFLTAYYTIINHEKILTGSQRMQERPIGILVDALEHLGGTINYLKNKKYPPIHILNFEQKNDEVALKANISSQYISALLMVAPVLPKGLKINILSEIYSKPYIDMTLALMAYFGIDYRWENQTISIDNQIYKGGEYTVESDWSGASYWYSLVALSKQKDIEIKLHGLKKKSYQGDRVIVEIMDALGVMTRSVENGVLLSKKEGCSTFEYDFTHCPDLAQTVAVVCATKNIRSKLIGLHSLPIKETDRLLALKTELEKFGVQFEIDNHHTLTIKPSNLIFNNQCIETYKDHRMAMAFAPLGMIAPIRVSNSEVVEKSYPNFWKDLSHFISFE